jgi:hypothetical protein
MDRSRCAFQVLRIHPHRGTNTFFRRTRKMENSKAAKTTGVKVLSKGVSKLKMASGTCCKPGASAAR